MKSLNEFTFAAELVFLSPPSQAECEVGANELVSVFQAEDALLVGGTLCELKKGAAQTDHLSIQDFWEVLGKTGFPS